MPQFWVPPEVDGLQVNFCRNPCCANYGIPAQVTPISRGRQAGHVVVDDLPTAEEASCSKRGCSNHGRAIAATPDGYRIEKSRSKAWIEWWLCRACGRFTPGG